MSVFADYPNTPVRYKSVGPRWFRLMICKTCGWEHWDCTCPEDEDSEGRMDNETYAERREQFLSHPDTNPGR